MSRAQQHWIKGTRDARLLTVLFAVLVGFVGGHLVYESRATTPTASTYAAAGTVSSAAGVIDDTTSAFGKIVQFANASDTTAPSVPTGVKATANSATKVTITWTASTDNVGVDHYLVSRGTTVLGQSATTSYVDSTAQPSTTYSYTISAVDAAGNTSTKSTAAIVTTPSLPDTQAPTAPTDLKGTASIPVDLTWTASTDNVGVTGYNVFRNGSSTPLNAQLITGTSYGDGTAAASTTYTYVVKAYDAADNVSPASNIATVTTGSPPPPTNGCATTTVTHPSTYQHVVWIWEENKTFGGVMGSKTAPVDNGTNSYIVSLAMACGYSNEFKDNMFGTTSADNLVSEPHYVSGTAGTNCNSGLFGTGSPSGCMTTDGPATTSNSLSRNSIFDQITSAGKTWKSYQEDMGSACQMSDGTNYKAKHNPPVFFSILRNSGNCAKYDLPIPSITCTDTSCTTPPNSPLLTDINNGTLPNFSFITPNLQNDMHDGSIAQGNQWLKTYVTKILNGPNYQAGNTAVFILWDEGVWGSGSTPVLEQPNIFVTPYTKPTGTTTAFNQFAVLRATEQMLGLSPTLGCASGTLAGATCPSGSTVDIRSLFNM